MSKLDNKIEARHRNLFDVLNAQNIPLITFSASIAGVRNILKSWLQT